ncbi:hypothetical protein [Congregibacter litoralis]|uniref:Uncharacterized protein n=1 Tax=Congregibacter litoralis KT71 TaxID=314285 RepID=A4A8C2_9GAMM|nr:hypothetical protein [Congregibacter litoralis]EAQ97917.1 hypothetical protein KT71_15169 [Congregibacter litoralis KT71]
MLAFRVFMAALFVALTIYTAITITNHGWNLMPVFFGDMKAMTWPGQFNADFLGFFFYRVYGCHGDTNSARQVWPWVLWPSLVGSCFYPLICLPLLARLKEMLKKCSWVNSASAAETRHRRLVITDGIPNR